jgi:hypothetical protein
LLLREVVVKGAFLGVGTLGKVAGIIGVIGAGVAQIPLRGLVQGDTGMTVGFESCPAMRTSDRSFVDRLLTMGTIQHGW